MAVPTLKKQLTESRLYDLDFSANLATGELLSTIVSLVAAPTGLTLSDQAIWTSGRGVQVRIAGGVAASYKITAVVTTSAGNTLEGEGVLNVSDN